MKKKIQKLYETSNPSNEKYISASLSYPDCELYCASDETKSVYIYKSGAESPILTLGGHVSSVTSMLLYSENSELYSGLKGGSIYIWDLGKTKVKSNLQGHSNAICTMSLFEKDNSSCVLASASMEGKMKLWDLRSTTPSINFKGHFHQINTLAFSSDLTYLASGSVDGLVKLWDLRCNKILKEFSAPDQRAVNCLAFNPCTMHFASGSKDKTIRYWDLDKYSMLSFTPSDRLPIEALAFENDGHHLFSATNESLKYWVIEDNELRLVDMFETGWNKLHSFRVINHKAVYGLSIFSKKISYYAVTYDTLFTPNKHKRSNSEIKAIAEESYDNSHSFIFNQNSIRNDNHIPTSEHASKKDLNEYMNGKTNSNVNDISSFPSLGISQFISNNPNQTNLSLTVDSQPQQLPPSIFQQKMQSNQPLGSNSGNDKGSIFVQNAMNMMKNSPKPKIQPKEHSQVENNIFPQIIKNEIEEYDDGFEQFDDYNDISLIHTQHFDDTLMDDPIFELDSNLNPHNNDIGNNPNTNKINKDALDSTATSFVSVQSSQTMGLDFNQFTSHMNETVHGVSQSQDLPIIQEINDQHNVIRTKLTTRFNSVKMLIKWWSESNIDSTLNVLKINNNKEVTNDFFKYALIARGDLSKIPFTLDHSIFLLTSVQSLINSKFYCATGCKAVLLLIQILFEKINKIKQTCNATRDQFNPFIDERASKCDQLIEQFKLIFYSKKLSQLKTVQNNEVRELATRLHTDLDFFLVPYLKASKPTN